MRKREIRQKYDEAVRWYDLAEALPELLGVRRWRREVFGRAEGRVLEVACGTGKNFRWYADRADGIVAVDLSEGMLAKARERAQALGADVRFAVMDAELLALRDAAFDTVLSSLTTCTFTDPVRALREMSRVCRPDGRILLLEHGRSDREWIGRLQDRFAEGHYRRMACRWNREPHELVRESGLRPVERRRTFFGVFHIMELAPT
ncbi:MAG: class I SAM-dependent methyltransferase [Gemmatimonadota bacterium]